MKVAITGHTSGIGKALHEIFPDAVVFSRSNGFDLTISQLRQRMYTEIDDCDVFINNAPIGLDQIHLLHELWGQWKDSKKIIVNIGSDASDYDNNDAYTLQKKMLQDLCLQYQQSTVACKTILVKPGYVDTPRVQSIIATKIDPKEFASYVKELIECRHSTFWIPVVTLYPR